MTKQQFDDLYLGKAVHCDTEEKANDFLKLAHGFGYEWCSGRSLLAKNNYHEYQEKTCYSVARYGFACSPEDFYIEKGYEVVEFKQEKETKMKFKVGDKVRVKSGLKKGQLLGISLKTYHENLENNVFTIVGVTGAGRYNVEETEFILSDEMLEPADEPNGYAIEDTQSPTKETFNVGDVLYTDRDDKVTLLELGWRVKFENGKTGFRRFSQLRREAPLQKITRKELAEMGYELED